ncbi:hypothetical protein PTTG_25441 [Puccinia triticina 1-1 BBBD Race 1]|uniref:Lactamase_B domain-containing protein n=1 Tax=Puccinia triticina (isolate 1-1 / race 1 (BBBD)) TaxID=630390 RepID=A0A180H200_PUCT1|nr:hypothetical protein PTTG_25441 [Puccinia triticina 1-1 BBBD Race 1]
MHKLRLQTVSRWLWPYKGVFSFLWRCRPTMSSPVSSLRKLRATISTSSPTNPHHEPATPTPRCPSAASSADSAPASLSPGASPPTHHLPGGSGFRNPWPSASSSQASHLAHLINNGIPLQLAKKPSTDLKPVRTLPADLKLYASHAHPAPPSNTLVSTWLGHAGYLVQFPMLSRAASSQQKPRPFRILFDPMFSVRAGPTQWTGPKRLKPSPCHIKQIPTVDICFISHSHYDHLDYDTIQELSQRQPHLKYFVPLGLKAWFDCVSVPSDQVVELDWWQSRDWDPAVRSSQQATPVDRASAGSSTDDASASIRLTCVPAQHSSGRSLLDQNTSLWCGWIVEQIGPDSPPPPSDPPPSSSPTQGPRPPLSVTTTTNTTNTNTTSTTSTSSNQQAFGDHRDRRKCCVYFAGDTGYRSQHDRELTCPAFKEIGERFGPIDFSMIPIWRGGTLSFVSWAGLRISDPNFLVVHHASPEDAVRIHQDVRSKHSIGIHHSCFIGNDLESLEALVELDRAKDLYNVPPFDHPFGFGVVDVGETVEIDL